MGASPTAKTEFTGHSGSGQTLGGLYVSLNSLRGIEYARLASPNSDTLVEQLKQKAR